MSQKPPRKGLDALDWKILKALLDDSRLSYIQLAEQIGLSATPCWQRVKRLEQDGYIKGYTARLDQELLGAGEIVIIELILDHHDDKVLEELSRELTKIPEILEVYLTTGEYDYLIKVAVDGTKGYEEFLRKKLYKIPGIRQSRSSFTLRCLKNVQAFLPTHHG